MRARKGSPKAVMALAYHRITVVYQMLSPAPKITSSWAATITTGATGRKWSPDYCTVCRGLVTTLSSAPSALRLKRKILPHLKQLKPARLHHRRSLSPMLDPKLSRAITLTFDFGRLTFTPQENIFRPLPTQRLPCGDAHSRGRTRSTTPRFPVSPC
jgi:hypothetical protein